MERRHYDHVIVQLSAHEMQRTRMLCVLGRFVTDQLLPSGVCVCVCVRACVRDNVTRSDKASLIAVKFLS